MRISPIAIYAALIQATKGQVFELAQIDSELTHGSLEA
jgi:hypothetical protein